MSNAQPSTLTLLTVKDFCEKHPAFSQGSLRSLIFNSQDRLTASGETIPGNGLSEAGAIVRIGRRILIDETAFFRWVRGKNSIRLSPQT